MILHVYFVLGIVRCVADVEAMVLLLTPPTKNFHKYGPFGVNHLASN